jgi:hypothetical protein
MPGGRSDAYRKQLSGMPRSKLGKLVKSAGLAVSCRAVRPPCNPNEVTSAEALGPRYLVFQARVHLLAQCRIHCPQPERGIGTQPADTESEALPHKSQNSAACDNLVAAAYFAPLTDGPGPRFALEFSHGRYVRSVQVAGALFKLRLSAVRDIVASVQTRPCGLP